MPFLFSQMPTIAVPTIVNVVVKNVKMMQNVQHPPSLKQKELQQKQIQKLKLVHKQKQQQKLRRKQQHKLKQTLRLKRPLIQIPSVVLLLHYRNVLKQIAITTIIIAIIAVHVRVDVLNSLIAAQVKVLDIK